MLNCVCITLLDYSGTGYVGVGWRSFRGYVKHVTRVFEMYSDVILDIGLRIEEVAPYGINVLGGKA